MPTKRTSDTQQPKARRGAEQPKPKKKGEQSPTEATRADVPDEGERPVGEGAKDKKTSWEE